MPPIFKKRLRVSQCLPTFYMRHGLSKAKFWRGQFQCRRRKPGATERRKTRKIRENLLVRLCVPVGGNQSAVTARTHASHHPANLPITTNPQPLLHNGGNNAIIRTSVSVPNEPPLFLFASGVEKETTRKTEQKHELLKYSTNSLSYIYRISIYMYLVMIYRV